MKKDEEREVRRVGKSERRIAGWGMVVGGTAWGGSGGGDEAAGMVNGGHEKSVDDVGFAAVSDEVKSSHGSSSSVAGFEAADGGVCFSIFGLEKLSVDAFGRSAVVDIGLVPKSLARTSKALLADEL